MSGEKTKEVLKHRKNLKLKLVWQGALIGLVVGLVIVLNRLAISKVTEIFGSLYLNAKGNPLGAVLLFSVLIVIGAFVGFLVKSEPMISGSGIPQVEGFLLRKLNIKWLKVLIYKFVGGVMCLGTGLSLGREGPSVQMGAAIGQGFGQVFKRVKVEEKYLTTSGASAGLAAAFNAPLSGVMFSLEEIHKNFSPLALLSAMAAAMVADFVSKYFLGLTPALNISSVKPIPLNYYWTLILLGIIVGVGGVIFNSGILTGQRIYEKFKGLKVQYKAIIPFVITGFVGIFAPLLLGGGHELIMNLPEADFTVITLSIFLIVKFILLIICFGSGVPGGIFFPLLVLGALVGNIFGLLVCTSLGIPKLFIVNFIILAMAGNFSSIVKAPITGIVLICEMTGSFEHLLSLAIVSIFAYITSDLLKSHPIYESLLDNILRKNGEILKESDRSKTLLEFVIHIGSELEGEFIKNINWPEECLLVAIKRGNKEILPKGDIKLLGGDYIVAMVDENRVSCVIPIFEDLCEANTG